MSAATKYASTRFAVRYLQDRWSSRLAGSATPDQRQRGLCLCPRINLLELRIVVENDKVSQFLAQSLDGCGSVQRSSALPLAGKAVKAFEILQLGPEKRFR